METPQVGDINYGGVVFFVDTTNEFALIEGDLEVTDTIFIDSDLDIDVTTSNLLYGGIANTEAITQYTVNNSAFQIISDYVQENTNYNDWYIGNSLEMRLLINSEVSRRPFERYSYYGISHIDNENKRQTKILNTYILSGSRVIDESIIGVGVSFLKFRYIRKHNYNPTFISLENIAGKEIAQQDDNLSFGFISHNNNVSISQKISLRSRIPTSFLICFYIDMTKLADGYLPTPQSLFSELPGLTSVRDVDGNKWFANSSTGSNSLSTIVNGHVYQLTFETPVATFVEIKGDLINTIIITVPQGESWFPMILGDKTEVDKIFDRNQLSKITSIHDITTGNYYPSGGLKDLEIGRGYVINTSGSFTHKFVLR